MTDRVLRTGDRAVFEPRCGAAVVVVVAPVPLRGSARLHVGGVPALVEGDEAAALLAGCPYTTPTHPVPGVGVLRLDALAADSLARTTSAGRHLLLVGGAFTTVFQVLAPALQPTATGPVADTTTEYAGSGRFTAAGPAVRAR